MALAEQSQQAKAEDLGIGDDHPADIIDDRLHPPDESIHAI